MGKRGKAVACVLVYLAIWGTLTIIFLPIVVFFVRIWWELTKLAWEVVL